MVEKTSKRSEDEIKKIKTELFDNEFGPVRQKYKEAIGYYKRNVNIPNMPPDVTLYKPPTATEDVHSAVAEIQSLGYKVVVPYWDKSQETQESAAKLERFCENFLTLRDKRYKYLSNNLLKSGVICGVFISKGPLYLSEDRLKDNVQSARPSLKDKGKWEYYLQTTFPFTFRFVHPLNCVWVTDELVIETMKRRVMDIQAKYPWYKSDKDPMADVDWWEYHSNTQIMYVADGEVVEDMDNQYGFIPYEIGYSGFGFESEEDKKEDAIVSMLDPNLSAYMQEYRSKTAVFAAQEYDVYDKVVFRRPLRAWEKWSYSPGEPSYIEKDAGPEYAKARTASPDLYRGIQIINEDQEKTVPKILHGGGQKYESGYGQMTRYQAAKLALLTSLKANYENACANELEKAFYVIANVVQEPVGIMGNIPESPGIITIDPKKDVNLDNARVFVKMMPDEAEQNIQKEKHYAELWAMGFYSKQTCHKELGKDYIEERERWLLEQILLNPRVRDVLTMEAMENAKVKMWMQELDESAQAQDSYNPQAETTPMGAGAPQHGMGQTNKLMMGGTGGVAPLHGDATREELPR